ncbi:MAG TPA: glycosyltransferase, partial [Thermoanaerobaculia bacterium]|nr:glycosyltransferase [Thermoanaerobaculia bacterium]
MPSAPLKIVHIAATPIGAPWMVALMCEQKRLGHEVAAILPSEGGIAAQLASHGISFHVADVDVLFALPTVFQKAAALLRLARLLRRLRPDIVHSHIFNSVVTARLASWLADVPLHIGGNVHPFSLESDVLRPIEVGTAFCDGVTVASTSYTRELMVRHGIPANKIALIFYAVDQRRHDPALADGSRVRNELGIAADTPVVGKIAYFYPPAKNGAILTTPLKGRG